MSSYELEARARRLKEIEREREALQAESDALKDEIKAYMGDATETTAGPFKLLWKPVASRRLDTAALKRELPEIAQRYTVTAAYRRFLVQ